MCSLGSCAFTELQGALGRGVNVFPRMSTKTAQEPDNVSECGVQWRHESDFPIDIKENIQEHAIPLENIHDAPQWNQ